MNGKAMIATRDELIDAFTIWKAEDCGEWPGTDAELVEAQADHLIELLAEAKLSE